MTCNNYEEADRLLFLFLSYLYTYYIFFFFNRLVNSYYNVPILVVFLQRKTINLTYGHKFNTKGLQQCAVQNIFSHNNDIHFIHPWKIFIISQQPSRTISILWHHIGAFFWHLHIYNAVILTVTNSYDYLYVY